MIHRSVSRRRLGPKLARSRVHPQERETPDDAHPWHYSTGALQIGMFRNQGSKSFCRHAVSVDMAQAYGELVCARFVAFANLSAVRGDCTWRDYAAQEKFIELDKRRLTYLSKDAFARVVHVMFAVEGTARP